MSFLSTIGDALFGGSAQKAADAQVGGLASAITEQRRVGGEIQEDLSLFKEGGTKGLNALLDLLGLNGPEASQNALANFETSPGFQFRLGEGVDAVDRGASASGLLGSGSRLKALTKFGQGLASEEFGNRVNRLFALTNQGQTATTTGVNARLGIGSNIGNALIDQGAARASGFVGQSNAITGTFNSLLNLGGRLGAAKILAG